MRGVAAFVEQRVDREALPTIGLTSGVDRGGRPAPAW
jgi:hypothetical protein